MYKRVFLIVLDSLGIGELPDADKFGDKGVEYVEEEIEAEYLKRNMNIQ